MWYNRHHQKLLPNWNKQFHSVISLKLPRFPASPLPRFPPPDQNWTVAKLVLKYLSGKGGGRGGGLIRLQKQNSPIDCTQIITICRVSVKVVGENNELCFDEISEYLFTFHFTTSSCRAEPVHNHSSSVLTRPQLFKRYVYRYALPG